MKFELRLATELGGTIAVVAAIVVGIGVFSDRSVEILPRGPMSGVPRASPGLARPQ